MQRSVIVPVLFGAVGVAILLRLGFWQVERLGEKEAAIARIEARIAEPPVPLPDTPDPDADKYLPVTVTGDFTGEDLRVLVSLKQVGAGYRVISVMETEAGRILVDRGFVEVATAATPRPAEGVTITGNLHWPDEVDGYTPEPDTEKNLWFARDVSRMARHLDARPVLVVAAQTTEEAPVATPLRVDTAHIPNDHLEYAITWFALAAIWAAMTGYFLWRTRRRPAEGKDS
ncbi:SURF1 family protein [Roseovarius sp. SCSIO 43702]|uniref:SURF1 family protein n=1 Tax=Roseovarius sp. SCSIO 43702 TaxID=2823043 RepID=UPI001C72DCEF|nr:SURF1 family protein [Roseovarius sp. SCSIO 43702]QYX57569.1 SURF1 family protein [Roseovarius sp. SCSIO 43702]